MRRLFTVAPPTRRLLGLLALALAVLALLLTVATPSHAGGRAQAARPVPLAARASSSQPAMSSTPPSGVTGPSHRAPVKLKP